MKRLALWLAVAMLPACCAYTVPKQASKLTMAEQLQQETVALVMLHDENGNEVTASEDLKDHQKAELHAYCSGVWVSNDTILTAEHCVDDIGRPKPTADDALQSLLHAITGEASKAVDLSWTPVGQPVKYSVYGNIAAKRKDYNEGTVTAVDMVNDLALVKAAVPGKHPFASLSTSVVHVGDELHMMGMTHGMWWCYLHGYVAAFRPDEPDTHEHKRPMMQVQAPISGGDSGSGAFDAEGNLVGVCDLVTSSLPEVAWYVPRDIVRGFLEHYRVIAATRK